MSTGSPACRGVGRFSNLETKTQAMKRISEISFWVGVVIFLATIGLVLLEVNDISMMPPFSEMLWTLSGVACMFLSLMTSKRLNKLDEP
jgi:tellurite resistance protein TehA-like permease